MNRKCWYLKQLHFFKSLSDEEVEYIGEHSKDKEYGKRQVLLEPDDKDKVFILKSGSVEIYELTEDGKKIIVDTLGPGNVFGDLGINESSEHFVEAIANAYVCVMNKNDFFDMVANNPAIANVFVRELFTKVVESEKQIAALASDNLLIKIKNLLSRLAKKHGEKKEDRFIITTKFTHEDLADMIGISRPTMTELLNKLEKGDVIKRQGKIISYSPQKLLDL